MRVKIGLLAACFPLLLVAAAAQVANYETAGNLKPAHALDCIAFDQVKNIYTPADLLAAHLKCVHAGRYEDGFKLWLLASAYANFDARRVLDATARDAFQAMMADNPPDRKTLEGIRRVAATYSVQHSPELAKLCSVIKRIGPPDYYPRYMLAHGMSAVRGSGGGLVKGFDAGEAWNGILVHYLRCGT